jgi:hypothetical protein
VLTHSRRAAEQKNAAANTRPLGTRAAGVGGSSGTMLKLYTDDVGRGFKVYFPIPLRAHSLQEKCLTSCVGTLLL